MWLKYDRYTLQFCAVRFQKGKENKVIIFEQLYAEIQPFFQLTQLLFYS